MARTLRQEATVAAAPAAVWEAWTTDAGVRTFFAPDSHVELRPGGPYELYFMTDAPAGQRGSEGCTIVEFEPARHLVFTWNFPPTIPTIRDQHTRVAVDISPAGPASTRVVITQTGWKRGKDWDRGFDYFTAAWAIVLRRLAHRFAGGPVDWSDPFGS